jgi:hypothetical protein
VLATNKRIQGGRIKSPSKTSSNVAKLTDDFSSIYLSKPKKRSMAKKFVLKL